MYVKCDIELDNFFADIIKDELNIKSVDFTNEVDNLVSYSFKPQLKTVGPKYGKQLGEIRTALTELDGNAAKAELDANGELVLNLSSGKVCLGVEDLLIEAKQKEGFFTVSDHGITVALDTTLTDELIEEGFVREIVSKIQTMRKEAGFNVTDHINITMCGSKRVIDIVTKLAGNIAGDTLADEITAGDNAEFIDITGYSKEWDINGEKLTIGVKCI